MPTTAVGLTNGNGGQDALRNHATTKGEGHASERYMCARACFFPHNSSRMAGLKITQVDIVRLAIKHMPVDNSYEDFVRETALTIEEATGCSRAEAVLLMYDAFGDILLIHTEITGKDTIPAELKMKYNAFMERCSSWRKPPKRERERPPPVQARLSPPRPQTPPK